MIIDDDRVAEESWRPGSESPGSGWHGPSTSSRSCLNRTQAWLPAYAVTAPSRSHPEAPAGGIQGRVGLRVGARAQAGFAVIGRDQEEEGAQMSPCIGCAGWHLFVCVRARVCVSVRACVCVSRLCVRVRVRA